MEALRTPSQMSNRDVWESSSGASASDIDAHYSLGNDFYSLWLCNNMVYSCAMWQESDSLESAQLRKIDYHLDSLSLGPGQSLLDIGCGWGGLLNRAKQKDLSHSIGLTLSRSQFDWHLSKRAKDSQVFYTSWEEFDPPMQFDGIVSIGFYEHLNRFNRPPSEKILRGKQFFSKCSQWLKEQRYLSLQTIIYDKMKPGSLHPFITETVFPGSDLPTLEELSESYSSFFSPVAIKLDGLDYVKTLNAWESRLKVNKMRAISLLGADGYRRYCSYFRMSARGFRDQSLNLARILLVKK